MKNLNFPKNLLPVEAVIFDWDGTIADTRVAVVSSFQQTLKEVNITIQDMFIERRIGIGATETFREILQEKDQPVSEELVKQLVENKSQNQIHLKNQVTLFSGAKGLLESLQGKAKVGLASMNSRSVIETLVKTKGLGDYFQAIVTGDDVNQPKPDPEVFLTCAKLLGVLPLRCLVVEDSIFGVRAAKAAGMFCVAVTTGAYSKEELTQEKPDMVVTSLQQVSFISQHILVNE